MEVEKSRVASGYAEAEKKTGQQAAEERERRKEGEEALGRWKTQEKRSGKARGLFLLSLPFFLSLLSYEQILKAAAKKVEEEEIRKTVREYEKWKLGAGKSPDVNANRSGVGDRDLSREREREERGGSEGKRRSVRSARVPASGGNAL